MAPRAGRPIAVDIVHIDEGRDYLSSTVTVRKIVGRSESVTTFSLPILLTVEQAQVVGQRALREFWQGRESYDLKLPTRWLQLDPTDTIEIEVDGVTRRLLITSVTYGRPGLVLVRGIAADGGNPDFVTVGTGSGSIPPAAPEPVAPVKVELLDIPLLRDADDAAAACFYMATSRSAPAASAGRRCSSRPATVSITRWRRPPPSHRPWAPRSRRSMPDRPLPGPATQYRSRRSPQATR